MKQGKSFQKGKQGAPNKKNYTRRNSSKNQRRGKEIEDTAYEESKSNPPQEYMKNELFARDAAKLPFSTPLGVFLNPYRGQQTWQRSVPGVMLIHFIPVPGVSRDLDSPINQASLRYWTYLRSVQKAAGDYNHQDITMMVYAIDSALGFHSFMRRIYRLLRNFTPVNRYYPAALIDGMGVSFNDLLSHISDFRSYINQFAHTLTQYALPAGISLFWRHQWMCEGYYLDSSTTKAQTYMFVPNGFYWYNNQVEEGSQLDFHPLGSMMTFDQLVTYGNGLLAAMSNDEDFAFISGDMYNLYNGNTYQIPFTPEDDNVLPLYDKVVLSQIENMTILGSPNIPSLTIKQDPSVNGKGLIFDPIFNHGAEVPAEMENAELYMNFHVDSPSPEDVMDASRLMVAQEYPSGKILTCGTELVTSVSLLYRYKNPAGSVSVGRSRISGNFLNLGYSDLDYSVSDILEITQFDWSPIIELWAPVNPAEPGGALSFNGWINDIDNYSPISVQQLTNINTAALWSLYEMPRA